MVKKITILVVLAVFFVATMPVFAGGGPTEGSKGRMSAGSADDGFFQQLADNISEMNTEANSAKGLSLRGNKEEIMKRRGLIKR